MNTKETYSLVLTIAYEVGTVIPIKKQKFTEII